MIEPLESVEPGGCRVFIVSVLMDVAHGIVATDATIAMSDISRTRFSFVFRESWGWRELG